MARKSVRRKYSNKRGYKKINKSMTRTYKKRIYKRKNHKRYGGGLDKGKMTQIKTDTYSVLIKIQNHKKPKSISGQEEELLEAGWIEDITKDINSILIRLFREKIDDSTEFTEVDNVYKSLYTNFEAFVDRTIGTQKTHLEAWTKKKKLSLDLYIGKMTYLIKASDKADKTEKARKATKKALIDTEIARKAGERAADQKRYDDEIARKAAEKALLDAEEAKEQALVDADEERRDAEEAEEAAEKVRQYDEHIRQYNDRVAAEAQRVADNGPDPNPFAPDDVIRKTFHKRHKLETEPPFK